VRNTSVKIGNLLNSFPSDGEGRSLYLENAKKYSTECGCSLGAKFLAASIGVFIVYLFLSHDFGLETLIKQMLFGTFFVFTASIVGKLIGIGIARIRLVLLYRYLVTKYQTTKYNIPGE
jgi:hypothetical protein